MSRNADAERIALRATEANPRNAQAWFVLAFTRNAQRNRDGAREARGRCVALGGQWAAECRALP
jgi:predicted Zn-dependent protease